MPTYTELIELKSNDALKNKIEAAIAEWGVQVRAENGAVPDHAKRVTLATRTLGREREQAEAETGSREGWIGGR